LLPLKAGWKNVIARMRVRFVPLPLVDEAEAFTEHWLFWSVPPCAKVTGGCHAVPASFVRNRLLSD